MNMAKKNALGRGLGALIDGVEKEVLEKKVEANLDIPVDSIEANVHITQPVVAGEAKPVVRRRSGRAAA